MTRHLSRRLFLATALSGLAGSAFANAPTVSLRPKPRPVSVIQQGATAGAEAVIARARLSGTIGFAVADAKTGKILEQSKADLGLPPASVAKAVTALYALDVLGADYRFTTSLVATGRVENGVLKGDLVLVGGGDPTLDTDMLGVMAARLKAAGVKEVQGEFQVWGGALPYVRSIDPGQPDHLGYSPAVSGLSLNYNRVHFEWKRVKSGYAVTMDARSNKYRPDVSMATMKIVDRGLPVYTFNDAGAMDNWTVAKSALNDFGSRWLPVRQPEKYAGDAFRSLAKAQGINLKAPEVTRNPPAGKALVSIQSAPLVDILKAMLKYSTNITAEMVGLTATRTRLGGVGSLKASASEMNRWAAANLGMTNSRLADHSGLGDDSRIEAGELVNALIRVKRQKALRPILKEVALRHDNGKVNKSHPITVQAKTGTLNFVSGLAGYMSTRDGTDLAFAIFVADIDARDRIKRNERERPDGARGWNKRAKGLQQQLIERWGAVYGS